MHARVLLFSSAFAESWDCEIMDGHVYFPAAAIDFDDEAIRLTPSATGHKTWCPTKGQARYYDLDVNDGMCSNAAWYFPEPKEKAKRIRGMVAFGKPFPLSFGLPLLEGAGSARPRLGLVEQQVTKFSRADFSD